METEISQTIFVPRFPNVCVPSTWSLTRTKDGALILTATPVVSFPSSKTRKLPSTVAPTRTVPKVRASGCTLPATGWAASGAGQINIATKKRPVGLKEDHCGTARFNRCIASLLRCVARNLGYHTYQLERAVRPGSSNLETK